MSGSSAFAQLDELTFTGNSQSGVFSILFNFGDSGEAIAIDQVGADPAIDVNNDGFGTDISVTPATSSGTLESFGIVEAGDFLDPNDSATTSGFGGFLDLTPAAEIGDDILIGFLTNDDRVGFFTASFADPDGAGDPDFNGTLTFSSGSIATSPGASLTVGAVPEPSSLMVLGLVAGATVLRRRRA